MSRGACATCRTDSTAVARFFPKAFCGCTAFAAVQFAPLSCCADKALVGDRPELESRRVPHQGSTPLALQTAFLPRASAAVPNLQDEARHWPIPVQQPFHADLQQCVSPKLDQTSQLRTAISQLPAGLHFSAKM